LRAGVNLAALAFVLPAFSSLLMKKMDEASKDKRIAQFAGIFLAFGSAVMGLSSTWGLMSVGQIFYALGLVLPVPMRSLITGMVEQQHLATLYTALSVTSYSGMIIGRPLFAVIFGWGLRIGGGWIGLPFIVASGCFAAALGAVTGVTLGSRIEI